MNKEKIRQDIKRFGILRALYMRLMKLLNNIGIELNYVMTRPLQDDGRVSFCFEGLEYRLATRDDLYAATKLAELQLSRDFIDRALNNDDCCCAAFDNGRLISYVWRTSVEASHTRRLKIVVGEKQRYGYKALTLPNYRGRGIYPRLTNLADREFIRRGKLHAVSFTATHNFASLMADKKMGNRKLGVGLILQIGARTHVFHSPGVTKTGFRFVVNECQ